MQFHPRLHFSSQSSFIITEISTTKKSPITHLLQSPLTVGFFHFIEDDSSSYGRAGGISFVVPPTLSTENRCYLDDFSLGEFKNLLGPEVALDRHKHKLPKDFQKPKNLEYSMNMDLPVGYYRLRNALLSSSNDFWEYVVLGETLKYTR